MSVTYIVSGAGVNGGPVNRKIMVSVDMKMNDTIPRNCKKSDLAVYVEGPSNISNVSIMGGDRGKFHLGFTPTSPGIHWVDFVFQGVWASEPYKLQISDGANCPATEYEGKYRSGSVPLPVSSLMSSSAQEDDEKKKNDDRQRQEDEARKEEEARKKRDHEEQQRKEEEGRKKKEHEEQQRKEEDARKKKEHEEQQRKEEDARKKKEHEEQQRKEEEARKKREHEELEARRKKDRLDAIKAEFNALSNEELAVNIHQTMEKLQILIDIQQSRLH
jgi:hypothetical protein